MRVFNKLIRDKQPERIKADGYTPVVRRLNDVEYDVALRRKLLEEAEEVVAAMERRIPRHPWHNTLVREELADALEVLMAIAEHCGVEWDFVELTRINKAKARGGFDGRQLLVEVPDMPTEAET